MSIQDILAAIDTEISRLEEAKALLSKASTLGTKRAGKTGTTPAGKRKVKRVLSPEAIERIRAAQKKRWAKQKKAPTAAKKAAGKKKAATSETTVSE